MKRKIMTKELRQVLMDDFKEQVARDVIDVQTADYVMKLMTVYGVNIVALRQFVRLEDGLKPFSRRLLWTMYHDHKLYPDGRFVKVPEFIGHVAKYHPHGDIDTGFNGLVRPWENNAPLLTVRGNKGSESGETAAAVRYLDAKLSPYSFDCFFSEFDKDTAVMTNNYINSDEEPVFLPAKYPNFLINTSSGIGWGFAASYPPFNLNEAFSLTQSLIEHPEMKRVYLYPDSPRGYNVIDDGTIADVCEAGIGNIGTEAEVEYSEEDHALYVSGFPEKVMFEDVMEKISLKVKAHKISGIANMADTSSNGTGSFSIELRKDANPQQVINELFDANVGLRASATLGFYFAERTSVVQYGMRAAILEWIERRINQKQKYYIKKIGKDHNRMRNLSAIIPVIANTDSYSLAAKIIRNSEDDESALQALKTEFGLSSSQGSMLLDMKHRDSNKAKVQKYENEIKVLTERVSEYRSIITSKDSIKEVIYEDLEEGKKRHGKPRVCRVIKEKDRTRQEIFYRVVVSKRYIKKLSVASKAVGIAGDDEVIGAHPDVSENDKIVVIDTSGRSYTIAVKKILPSDATSKGNDMVSLVGLKSDAVRSFHISQELIDNVDKGMLSIFTTNGIIKTTPLSQYITNKTELQGIVLNDGDKVCWAHIYSVEDADHDYQLVYTDSGFGLAISMDNITTQDRATKGSQYLKLDGETVRGVARVQLNDTVLVITNKGYCKKCELASIFETKKRRQAMIKLTGLIAGDSVFKIIPIDGSSDYVTLSLKSGEKVKLNLAMDIPKLPRLAQGKKLVPVRLGDAIYKVTMG